MNETVQAIQKIQNKMDKALKEASKEDYKSKRINGTLIGESDMMTITVYVPPHMRAHFGGINIQGVLEQISISRSLIGSDETIEMTIRAK